MYIFSLGTSVLHIHTIHKVWWHWLFYLQLVWSSESHPIVPTWHITWVWWSSGYITRLTIGRPGFDSWTSRYESVTRWIKSSYKYQSTKLLSQIFRYYWTCSAEFGSHEQHRVIVCMSSVLHLKAIHIILYIPRYSGACQLVAQCHHTFVL